MYSLFLNFLTGVDIRNTYHRKVFKAFGELVRNIAQFLSDH
jgi:hypothetical protein